MTTRTGKSDTEELLSLIQAEFEKLLSQKPTWGRVMVLAEFDKAKIAALIRFYEH